MRMCAHIDALCDSCGSWAIAEILEGDISVAYCDNGGCAENGKRYRLRLGPMEPYEETNQ